MQGVSNPVHKATPIQAEIDDSREKQSGSIKVVNATKPWLNPHNNERLSDHAEKAIQEFLKLLDSPGKSISNFTKDYHLNERLKGFYQKEMSKLIDRHGHTSAIKLLQQWPNEKRGQIWFTLLVSLKFKHSCNIDSLFLPLLSGTDDSPSPHDTHQVVLKKLQDMKAEKTAENYCQFMTWLVQWDIFQDFPQHEKILKIPEKYRKMRPDFPDISGEERSMNEYCGWGFMGPISDYLAHTKRLKYFMICGLIENAPEHFKASLLHYWMKGDNPKTTTCLFSSDLHPLSMEVHETQLHHVLLYLLDSLLPDSQSELRNDLCQLQHQGKPVQYSAQSCFFCPDTPQKTLVFGRTLYHQKCSLPNGRHHYLKIQNHDEGKTELQTQFAKIEYFAKHAKNLGMRSTPVKPEQLVNIPNLSSMLCNNAVSEKEKAKLHWMCSETDMETSYDEILEENWDKSCYDSSRIAKRTRWIELLDDNSSLPDAKKRKLQTGLTSQDTSRLGLEFSSERHSPYHQYVYQSKTPEDALGGLEAYAHDFGLLWAKGVIAPDACSAYHDRLTSRQFNFLAPYNDRLNIGEINQHLRYSTDFPNIGPRHTSMRDMGDAFPIDEIDVSKLYPEAIGSVNLTVLKNRARLEYLAKAAWGVVLEYGRCFHSNFDHENTEKVASIETQLGNMLTELFSQSFKLEKADLLRSMKENGLLSQCAREVSYWMTTNYTKDLKNGVIPESVYPDYQGCRTGHTLSPYQTKNLTDEGFNDGYLGARNQPNPLLSLNILVIKMLSLGCLSMREKAVQA